jgi:hypothetical protein
MLFMKQTRTSFLGALLLLSLLPVTFISGCGGGSNPHNPFAGTWQGTFATNDAQVGTLHLTITDESVGVGTGTVVNTTAKLSGTLEGTITTKGVTELTYQYPDTPPINGDGTLQLGTDGKITGRIVATLSGQSLGYSDIVLTKQP